MRVPTLVVPASLRVSVVIAMVMEDALLLKITTTVPTAKATLPFAGIVTLAVAAINLPLSLRASVVVDADCGIFTYPIEYALPAESLIVDALARATVGFVPKTRDPLPVSSVTAVARLALDGVARNVATPAPRPETPVLIGNPVQLVRVPDAGVPKAGVVNVGLENVAAEDVNVPERVPPVLMVGVVIVGEVRVLLVSVWADDRSTIAAPAIVAPAARSLTAL